jgi:hypothetical protein
VLTIQLTLCHGERSYFWGDYFEIFYGQQDQKVKRKINYVLWLIRYTEWVPEKFLKHLEDSDGLYEIRNSTT